MRLPLTALLGVDLRAIELDTEPAAEATAGDWVQCLGGSVTDGPRRFEVCYEQSKTWVDRRRDRVAIVASAVNADALVIGDKRARFVAGRARLEIALRPFMARLPIDGSKAETALVVPIVIEHAQGRAAGEAREEHRGGCALMSHEPGPDCGHQPITELDRYTFGKTQTCFGCGPHNPLGLRLRFERDGDVVRSRYTFGAGYDGPPGILHGGLQAVFADEVAGWTLVGLRGRIGLTTSMQVRYIQSLRLGEEIVAEGRITSEVEGISTVQVVLTQGTRKGCVVRASFAMADAAKMREVLGGPLPDGWDKFFGGEGGPTS